ncbi:MAG: CoA transferase [Proteobacteria bacterium]|nr:CoA transferase [Pseudomonadota bacterium]
MFSVLTGLRVIEGASFIAAPSCALYLAQLGAEVIRFDMIGGGPDRNRWPATPEGASFYWEGLNKGKKSVAIDLSRPEGRALATDLITAPGPQGGLFVTNFPAEGFLSHQRLSAKRADLVTLRVMGWPDGATAVDYTVNAAAGYPLMTGPVASDAPVNHVLPAWDLVTGAYGAFALLAAERHRARTGEGQEVRLPLSDMAVATMGNLGQIAEVLDTGADRQRLGNDLFGAFGRDFRTADGRRVMIAAITPRQWTGLLKSLEIAPVIAELERSLDVTFENDEIARFRHRDVLFPIVEAAIARRSLDDLAPAFNANGVCWDRYQTVRTAVTTDPRWTENPILSPVAHPSGRTYPTPGSAASFAALPRHAAMPAPRLGQHTDEVLATVLGLSGQQIGQLHDQGIVAGAA